MVKILLILIFVLALVFLLSRAAARGTSSLTIFHDILNPDESELNPQPEPIDELQQPLGPMLQPNPGRIVY